MEEVFGLVRPEKFSRPPRAPLRGDVLEVGKANEEWLLLSNPMLTRRYPRPFFAERYEYLQSLSGASKVLLRAFLGPLYFLSNQILR